jgi:hypothetical protein
MRDLTSKTAICVKGALFLLLGSLAAALLLWESPSWRTAALLALTVWAFCRLYYFLFYVLEKHVDPSLKYAGLVCLAARAWQKREHAGPGARPQ